MLGRLVSAMVIVATFVGFVHTVEASSLDTKHGLVRSELAQDAEPSQSQRATGDGTLPFRILAAAMAGLAALLGALTFWYWKATVPPARRGYAPESPSIVEPSDEDEITDSPIDQMG